MINFAFSIAVLYFFAIDILDLKIGRPNGKGKLYTSARAIYQQYNLTTLDVTCEIFTRGIKHCTTRSIVPLDLQLYSKCGLLQ